MDVSVILPVVNERDNLLILVPRLKAVLEREKLSYEIVVVDGNSTDGTAEAATSLGGRVVKERRRGYAGALETGFAEARGDYVLTLDADLSHEPDFFIRMWRARDRVDIVIASRYARGGVAYTDWIRRATSWILNAGLRRMLSMPVGDLSSGYRLYRREAIKDLAIESKNFEVQEEVLVRAFANGFSITEVPFTYFPRGAGRSHAKILSFGMDIARTALRMWGVRNSLDSADYSERGFCSIEPVQRHWHRRRHHLTVSWARGHRRILDAGCGASLVIQSVNGAFGMDQSLAKLRFMRKYAMPLVNGSALALPFRDSSFDCVISSQVIERLPLDDAIFSEMSRVLRPGGIAIVGTPDYGTVGWRVLGPIGKLLTPTSASSRAVTQYTRDKLAEIMKRNGFTVEETAYIARSELIMRCRKAEPATVSSEEPARSRTSSAA